MRNTILIFSLIVASIFILAYCKHDATGIDQLPEVCFENQVLPIFQANCAMSGCHNGSGESFNLSSYSGIVQGVTAGDPEKSQIYEAITSKWGEMMPPKGNNPLTKDQRTLIYVWIKQGAKETTCSDDSIAQLPDTICYKEKIMPIMLTSCAISGCHNQTTAQSGVILSTYSGLMATTPIQLVVAGDAKSSHLFQVINSTMPPSYREPLTTLQKQEILTWINFGAEDNSCGTQVEYPHDTVIPVNDSICFEQKILPVLLSSCALSGCHDQASAQGDVILTSYSTLMSTGEVPLVNAGNANSSKIMQVIKGTGEDLMPPSPRSPLTSQQIEWFTTWINDGALNSSCESGCDTLNVTFANIVFPIVQNNCLGCHSGSSPAAGINLSTYANISTIATQGYLMGAVKYETGYAHMPPSGKLSDCNIRQLQIWVDAGAPNNK